MMVFTDWAWSYCTCQLSPYHFEVPDDARPFWTYQRSARIIFEVPDDTRPFE